MKIEVLYFARLRDLKGRASESVESDCRTVGDLYEMLGLGDLEGVIRAQVKPAVNENFCSYEAILSDGDVVAFMPPMAGG